MISDETRDWARRIVKRTWDACGESRELSIQIKGADSIIDSEPAPKHERLASAIKTSLGDLLICADDFDEEASDTAEILYNAAKDFGIDVSAFDEQIAQAVAKLHDMGGDDEADESE